MGETKRDFERLLEDYDLARARIEDFIPDSLGHHQAIVAAAEAKAALIAFTSRPPTLEGVALVDAPDFATYWSDASSHWGLQAEIAGRAFEAGRKFALAALPPSLPAPQAVDWTDPGHRLTETELMVLKATYNGARRGRAGDAAATLEGALELVIRTFLTMQRAPSEIPSNPPAPTAKEAFCLHEFVEVPLFRPITTTHKSVCKICLESKLEIDATPTPAPGPQVEGRPIKLRGIVVPGKGKNFRCSIQYSPDRGRWFEYADGGKREHAEEVAYRINAFESTATASPDSPPNETWTHWLMDLPPLGVKRPDACGYCHRPRGEHRIDLRCPIPNCTLAGPPDSPTGAGIPGGEAK